MPGDSKRIHFLDGLRGWAAFAVLMHHLWRIWLLSLPGTQGISWAINFTPLGALIDGSYAVCLFFTISGFALAYPVIVSNRPYRTLAGTALTRYTRLTIPILAACLFAQGLWSAGLFKNLSVGQALNNHWLTAFYAFDPRPGEMWSFIFRDVYFSYDAARSWNGVLWTMSIELVGSFWLFTLLILPTRWLRIPVAAYMAYAYFGQSYFGFFAGWLLAEVAVICGWSGDPSRPRLFAGWVFIFGSFALVFIARIYRPALGSLGYWDTLEAAAACMLLGVTLSRWGFPANRLSRFLGRISFPLYLVHLPIICSLGCGLYLLSAPLFGGLALVLFVGLITMAGAVAAAVLFSMLVDRAVEMVKRILLIALDAVWHPAEMLFYRAWRKALSPRGLAPRQQLFRSDAQS